MKKILIYIAFCVLFALSLTTAASALDYEDYGVEYEKMLDGIPLDIAELLPDGLFSNTPETIYGAVEEMSGFSYFLSAVGELLKLHVGDAVRLFATLLGLLVIAALLRRACELIRSPSLSNTLSMCSLGGIMSAVVAVQYEQLTAVSEFLGELNVFATSTLPIMGALYVAGGNVGAAAVNNSAMLLFLTVCENICNATVMPVTAVCIALALVSAFVKAPDLKGIATTVKKIYTFIISFIMSILMTVLAAQSTLTAAKDSLGGRAAKFMAGHFIPVVGGSVGESLKTVASSVAFIRTSVGVGGIVIIILLLLPTLISILLTRLAFMTAGSAARILGCGEEAGLLGELTSVYGYLLAVICSCSVMFIFALTLLARTSAAFG